MGRSPASLSLHRKCLCAPSVLSGRMCLTRPRSIFEALTRQPTPFLKIMSVLCVRAVLRWVCFLHIRSLSYLSTGSSAREVNLLHKKLMAAVPCHAGTRLPHAMAHGGGGPQKHDSRKLHVTKPAFSCVVGGLYCGFLNHFSFVFIAPFPVSRFL